VVVTSFSLGLILTLLFYTSVTTVYLSKIFDKIIMNVALYLCLHIQNSLLLRACVYIYQLKSWICTQIRGLKRESN